MIIIFLIILFSFIPSKSFELTRSVDRTSVQIGEPLVLTITAERTSTEKLLFPGPGSSFGDFELKDMRSEQEEKNGKILERKQYQLQIFKLGNGVIPQLKVVSSVDTTDHKLTDSITVIVKSSLLPADTGDIHDIYAPISLSLGRAFWITVIAVILVLVLLVVLFDRIVRKKKIVEVPPPPPPEPPQIIFEREVEALIAENLLNKGEVKVYHLKISEILRRYLGNRFDFEALESTTTELIDILRSKGISAQAMRKLEAFASVNDPVKFAKWIPSNDISMGLVDYAREIVQDTVLL
jgi:hypothetical protein